MILHNPIVSGSLTLSSNATFTANNGSVSGSGQIISLLPSGVVSGSSQVSLNGFDTDNLSEGSSNLYYTDTRVKTKLNAELFQVLAKYMLLQKNVMWLELMRLSFSMMK